MKKSSAAESLKSKGAETLRDRTCQSDRLDKHFQSSVRRISALEKRAELLG
jgi:hypothetical protein